MKYLVDTARSTLLHNLAQHLVDRMTGLLRQQDEITVALPGGNSIKAFLEVLLEYEEFLALERVTFYLVDERCSDDESVLNETLLRQCFFSKLLRPARMCFELNAKYEQYNQSYRHENWHLDIVLLGVGEDGHIASIFRKDQFPDYSRTSNSEALYLPVSGSPKPPSRRVTLSQKAILNADVIYLLFLGEEKRPALENFQNGDVTTCDCPAKLVRAADEKVWLVTDLSM